jgi:transcriptional regulator
MTHERFALLPGTLEMLVLKTLARGEQHGYAIARSIQERSADVLRIEEGSLYPALHRMERRGWIEAEWGPSESNRRAKYYALTKLGRDELAAQTDTWSKLSGAIEQVLEARAVGAEPAGA